MTLRFLLEVNLIYGIFIAIFDKHYLKKIELRFTNLIGIIQDRTTIT